MAHRIRRSFPALLGAAACVLAAACAPRIETRGNLPDPELVQVIKPGQHSKIDVEELLGSPSSVAAFDENTWFYVSKRTETLAFYRPETVEAQVLIVRFDAKGVVKELETRGLDTQKEVEPVDRETPTAGNEMTVLQQIFGNLGRFSKDTGKKK